jgi:hypothetical protein
MSVPHMAVKFVLLRQTSLTGVCGGKKLIKLISGHILSLFPLYVQPMRLAFKD